MTTLPLLALTLAPSSTNLPITGRLPDVLARSGAVFGAAVEAVPGLGRDVVVVVPSDDPDENRRRLARALGARWERTGQTLWLRADEAVGQAESRSALAARTEAVQREIDRALEPREDGRRGRGGPFDGDAWAARTAGLIGAAALAGIGPDQRVVFSTAPTRMQRPLPTPAITLAREGLAKEAERLTELAAQPREGGDNRFNPMERAMELRAADVAQVIAVAMTFANGIQLEVVSFGPDGRRILGSRMSIQPRPPAESAAVINPSPSPSEPIVLPDEARAAARLFAGGNRSWGGDGSQRGSFGGSRAVPPLPGLDLLLGTGERVDDALLASLTDPVGVEPLSLFVAPALEAYARAKGKALLANVPDAAFLGLAAVVAEPFLPARLEQALRSVDAVVEEDESWIVVRPVSTIEARSTRIDRAALKKLLDANRTHGRLRLADLAGYTRQTTGGPFRFKFDTAVVAAVDPRAALSMAQVYGPSRDALIVLGSLNASQSAQLEAGARLPVASLGGWATGLTSNLVFNSLDGPQMASLDDRPVRRRGRDGGRPVGDVGRFGRLIGDAQNERTVVLAQGLPPGTTLSMRKDEEPVALAKRGENDRGMVMNAQLLAFERARSEIPGMRGITMAPVSGYVPGRRVTYRLQWTLAPGITIERSVSEDDVPRDGRTVAYGALPSELIEATDKLYGRISEGIQRGLERFSEGRGRDESRRRGMRGDRTARP